MCADGGTGRETTRREGRAANHTERTGTGVLRLLGSVTGSTALSLRKSGGEDAADIVRYAVSSKEVTSLTHAACGHEGTSSAAGAGVHAIL